MDMETLGTKQIHDQIEYQCKDSDYVLYHSNTWVPEKELSNSYFPLLKAMWHLTYMWR